MGEIRKAREAIMLYLKSNSERDVPMPELFSQISQKTGLSESTVGLALLSLRDHVLPSLTADENIRQNEAV